MKFAGENRMVQRRDAGRGDSHQHFPLRNRRFWKFDELQPFITTKCFGSHCAHIISPLIQALVPPSTVRFAPVMYEDSGPATNATSAATSSTVIVSGRPLWAGPLDDVVMRPA